MEKKSLSVNLVLEYLFLIIVCLLSVFPFYWMLIGATNKSADVITGKLTFGTNLINNFKTISQK